MYARCLSGTKGGGSALESSGVVAIFLRRGDYEYTKPKCERHMQLVASSAKHSHCFTCTAWRARLLPFPAEPAPLDTHGAHVAIVAEFGRRPHPARVLNSEAACLARARGACFPSHQHLPDIAHSAPPSPACPSLPGSRLTGVGDGHKQWHAAWRTHSAMGSQWARPPATRNPSGDAITDCEPMLVALSRSNMFAHTRANGHERLIEHTVVVRIAAQIQPFLAVPYESRPSLPRR
jgi:hypothetical protein